MRHSLAYLCAFLWIILPAFADEPAGILEWGGSNYVAFDVDPDKLSAEDWRNGDAFHSPQCQLDAGMSTISADLRAMRAHHQRKVAFVLWHLSNPQRGPCFGYILNSTKGFADVVKHNISALVELSNELGFDEIQIRFAPLGNNSPRSWRAWKADIFEENWRTMHDIIAMETQLSRAKLTFDLGVELGGPDPRNCPLCGRYVQSMWAQYLKDFGNRGSYGFSVAYAPGRLDRYIAELGGDEALPKEFAVDIYGGRPGLALAQAALEARAALHQNPSLLVQETYNSNPETKRQLERAIADNRLSVRAVMQWPKLPNTPKRTFAKSVADFVYGPFSVP